MSSIERSGHRARYRLEQYSRERPGIWSLVDAHRAERASAIGTRGWPTYTFLPLEHAAEIMAAYMVSQGIRPNPSTIIGPAHELATLCAWRMTQGIYRFDPALYSALVDTPVTGDIPVDVLTRLPEWCVYLELDGIQAPLSGGIMADVHGAWAWIDHPTGDPRSSSLRTTDIIAIALDIDAPLAVIHVPLIGGSLRDALDALVTEWNDGIERGNTSVAPKSDWIDLAMPILTPILSLLLYLCSENAELSRRGRFDVSPGNPQPKRTRRHGLRLFPADGPAQWDVGVRIGAELRAAYQRKQTGGSPAPTDRSVRPHMRRAHWHTVLSGPRKRPDGTPIPVNEQRRELRWLPPIPINVSGVEELPATIRPVRQAK